MNLNRMGAVGMDSSGAGQGPEAGSCQCGNEALCSIKNRQSLEKKKVKLSLNLRFP
jgi:hypothetical protein